MKIQVPTLLQQGFLLSLKRLPRNGCVSLEHPKTPHVGQRLSSLATDFLELWTGQTLKPLYVLTPEATQLLAHIKTGTEAYKAKLKSGVLEFSITLSQATNKPLPADTVTYMENGHKYEETGYWHIIYQFDGARHFYDVKARNKMEFHGHSLSTTDENQKPLPTFRKAIMQVHRAVFNIPIAEEELGMTPDR